MGDVLAELDARVSAVLYNPSYDGAERVVNDLLVYKDQYLAALDPPVPNEGDRVKLKNDGIALADGMRVKLTAEQCNSVLYFAERLHVSELAAARALVDAGFEDSLAFQLQARARSRPLVTLIELMKARLDDRREVEPLRSFAEGLLGDEFLPKVVAGLTVRAERIAGLVQQQQQPPLGIRRAQPYAENTSGLVSTLVEQLADEHRLLCEIVFFATYGDSMRAGFFVTVLDSFRDAALLAALPSSTVSLFSSLCAAIDPLSGAYDGNPASGSHGGTSNALYQDLAFFDMAKTAVLDASRTWENRGAAGAAALLVATFAAQCAQNSNGVHVEASVKGAGAQMFELAVQLGGLTYVRKHIYESPFLENDDENGPFYRSVLGELCLMVLSSLQEPIDALRADANRGASGIESPSTRGDAVGGLSGSARELSSSAHFGELLRFVAAAVEDQPELAERIWSDKDTLQMFVVYAGRSLTRDLYVPYVCMLGSLASGHYSACATYQLLAEGAGDKLAWRDVFIALGNYYNDFARREGRAGGGAGGMGYAVAQARQQRLGAYAISMTDENVAACCAVLRLLRRVVVHAPAEARALCDDPGLNVVGAVVHLVSIPVPPELKADALRVLAALAALPSDTGMPAQLWAELEALQMVQSDRAGQACRRDAGVAYELQHIEGALGTYPLTRAALELLDTLAARAIPQDLGAGARGPGIIPYVDFALQCALSQFSARRYKDPNEQWAVAGRALSLALRLARSFDGRGAAAAPSAREHAHSSAADRSTSDFVDIEVDVQGARVVVPKSPGFTVLSSLLQGGPVFDAVVRVLDLAADGALERARSGVRYGRDAEGAVRDALLLIACASSAQDVLLQGVRSSSARSCADLSLARIETLLLRRPMAIVSAATLVSYSLSKAVAVAALDVLRALAGKVDSLVSIFSDVDALGRVMRALAVCFEHPEARADLLTAPAGSSIALAACRALRTALRELPDGAPSLGHVFCGFHPKRALEESVLDVPRLARSGDDAASSGGRGGGATGGARSCLPSVLRLALAPPSSAHGAGADAPRVREQCWEILAALVSSRRTVRPVLSALAAAAPDAYERAFIALRAEQRSPSSLGALAALLRCIAIDLHLSTQRLGAASQRPARLAALLFAQGGSGVVASGSWWPLAGAPAGAARSSPGSGIAGSTHGSEQARALALDLVEAIGVKTAIPVVPPTFAGLSLEDFVATDERGVPQIDWGALHAVLRATAPAGVADDAVPKLLRTCAKWNDAQVLVEAQARAMTAWSRCVEVAASECWEALDGSSGASSSGAHGTSLHASMAAAALWHPAHPLGHVASSLFDRIAGGALHGRLAACVAPAALALASVCAEHGAGSGDVGNARGDHASAAGASALGPLARAAAAAAVTVSRDGAAGVSACAQLLSGAGALLRAFGDVADSLPADLIAALATSAAGVAAGNSGTAGAALSHGSRHGASGGAWQRAVAAGTLSAALGTHAASAALRALEHSRLDAALVEALASCSAAAVAADTSANPPSLYELEAIASAVARVASVPGGARALVRRGLCRSLAASPALSRGSTAPRALAAPLLAVLAALSSAAAASRAADVAAAVLDVVAACPRLFLRALKLRPVNNAVGEEDGDGYNRWDDDAFAHSSLTGTGGAGQSSREASAARGPAVLTLAMLEEARVVAAMLALLLRPARVAAERLGLPLARKVAAALLALAARLGDPKRWEYALAATTSSDAARAALPGTASRSLLASDARTAAAAAVRASLAFACGCQADPEAARVFFLAPDGGDDRGARGASAAGARSEDSGDVEALQLPFAPDMGSAFAPALAGGAGGRVALGALLGVARSALDGLDVLQSEERSLRELVSTLAAAADDATGSTATVPADEVQRLAPVACADGRPIGAAARAEASARARSLAALAGAEAAALRQGLEHALLLLSEHVDVYLVTSLSPSAALRSEQAGIVIPRDFGNLCARHVLPLAHKTVAALQTDGASGDDFPIVIARRLRELIEHGTHTV